MSSIKVKEMQTEERMHSEGNPADHGIYRLIFSVFVSLQILGFLFLMPCIADVYRYVDKDRIIPLSNVSLGSGFKVWVRERPVRIRVGTDIGRYDGMIAGTAGKYDLDFALVKAVIKAESNFNTNAVSRKGAKGLMQLMPRMASVLGVNDCFDPSDNIDGGIRFLRYLLDTYQGDLSLAMAAYNAGEGAVARYRGIPPFSETRNYVRRVLEHYDQYRREAIVSPLVAITYKP
jgi:soluble lytic murein transglycosylase-like protein